MANTVVLKDHYVVLGARRDATQDELKKLYRGRARHAHPDVLGPDASPKDRENAEELFKELSTAYEQLSDPAHRHTIDAWLDGSYASAFDPFEDFKPAPEDPLEVPDPGQYLVDGIWCWIEYSASWYRLRATVTIQLADLFKLTDLGQLPHEARLEEVVAVDAKGDIVGRGYSLLSLRHDVRRLQAEARQNEDRRVWRVKLGELELELNKLTKQHRPVGQLRKLLDEARRRVESGVMSIREAEQRDTVIQAIREVEKEVERISTGDAAEILLNDLLNGIFRHPDLAYNDALLMKLRVYAFRSGEQYTAPTPEMVQAHYRNRLAGLTDHSQLYRVNLRLPDDEPTILEMVAEGLLELAPDTVLVQGNKKPTPYDVTYGYAKVNGEAVPSGIIVVPEAVYEKNGAQYGRTSKFPTLPHGITLLIRVRVKVQDSERVSDPLPDGKALLTEVQRCRARLRNPKELDELSTGSYLSLWPI